MSSIICWHSHSRGFWFRIFGYGLSIYSDPPRFAVRYGYTKAWRILRWTIEPLKPYRAQQ